VFACLVNGWESIIDSNDDFVACNFVEVCFVTFCWNDFVSIAFSSDVSTCMLICDVGDVKRLFIACCLLVQLYAILYL